MSVLHCITNCLKNVLQAKLVIEPTRDAFAADRLASIPTIVRLSLAEITNPALEPITDASVFTSTDKGCKCAYFNG